MYRALDDGQLIEVDRVELVVAQAALVEVAW